MTKVSPKISAELYNKGQEFLKNDGKIDQNELKQLNEIAAKNGAKVEEKNYIASLKNDRQVKEIKTGSSETVQKIFPDKKNDYQTLLSNVSDKKAFEELYKSGKLDQKDSSGKTILENLKEMSGTKMKGSVNGKQLMDETVAMLANRNNITQGPHGTCGAGAVQNYLWTKDPAEMIRIVKDLATDGKATLRDKSVITSGTNTDNWHKGSAMPDGSTESRSDFDIIFQSALMKQQTLMADYTDYNVQTDYSDGKSVLRGDSASDPYKVQNMLQSITGENYDTNMFDFERAKERVNEGKEVVAGYFTSDEGWGMHYVNILSIKDGMVTFQNTQQGTVDTMSEEDFKKKMFTAISKNDKQTGKPRNEDGFIGKVTDSLPVAIAATVIANPPLALVTAPVLGAAYIYKKSKDIIEELPKVPGRIKQAAVDANKDIKDKGWLKDEKGKSLTAKQAIANTQKETEARVLKNTGNKNASKVAGNVAKNMQAVVSTAAVGGVMVANKVKKTGQGIQDFGRSAKGMSYVTNVKANANLEAAKRTDISTKQKAIYKATGYGLKVVSKASAATGYVAEKTGKAVTYVGGKIEQATGAVVRYSKPVINAVSNTVGNIYAGASSAASSISSGASNAYNRLAAAMPWN